MQFLTELWLPIILTAVGVFIASSIIWMATPLHKKDYTPPPDEADIVAALKKHGFKPGMYYIPWCAGNMKDPGNQQRMKDGPWAMLMVPNGPPSFGRSLVLWFVVNLFIAAGVAYVAAAAVPMGENAPDYLSVFRVVGGAAFLAHVATCAHDMIWRFEPGRVMVAKCIDGVIYALLTAGMFAWLWPR